MEGSNEMNEDDAEYRKELDHQSNEMDRAADALSSTAAEMNKQASDLQDQARLIRLAATHGSDYGDWENTIESARIYNRSLESVFQFQNDYYQLKTVSATAGSAVVSGSYGLVSSQYYETIPHEKRDDFKGVLVVFDEYFEKKNYRSRVIQLLNQLAFDKTTEGKTAIERFEAAWELFFQNPKDVDVALGALISLRESIHITINELLRRRPNQKKVKEKIIGIGNQLSLDFVSNEIYVQLEGEFTPLVDELAGPKRYNMSIKRVGELMRKGTLFLDRLLSAIDKSKLR